jgi:tetratricopeptide (TPR) repeat protein
MAKTSTLLACTAIAIAIAAPRSADAGPKQDARAHVDRAGKAHKAGDLEKALMELQAAYGLDPQPQLLYALGQIYTKLGRCSEASEAYLRFLASGADARTTQVVKQAIDSCKPPTPEPAVTAKEPAPAAIDEEVPPEKAPPAAKAPPPTKSTPPRRVAMTPDRPPPSPRPASGTARPWYRDVVGDVLVVGGAVSIVLGGLAYRAAVTDLDTAEDVNTHERYDDLVDGARTKRLVGVALAGGGAVLVTVGVMRFMLRDKHTEVRRVGMAPARGGGLLTWTRSF